MCCDNQRKLFILLCPLFYDEYPEQIIKRLRYGIATTLSTKYNSDGRLEKIKDLLKIDLNGKTCKGMEGLLKEGDELLKEEKGMVLDQALIGAAQKVEHYEMASYGSLRTWARLMDNQQAASLLQQTLDEEGEADKKLTEIAESSINVEAMHANK